MVSLSSDPGHTSQSFRKLKPWNLVRHFNRLRLSRLRSQYTLKDSENNGETCEGMRALIKGLCACLQGLYITNAGGLSIVRYDYNCMSCCIALMTSDHRDFKERLQMTNRGHFDRTFEQKEPLHHPFLHSAFLYTWVPSTPLSSSG